MVVNLTLSVCAPSFAQQKLGNHITLSSSIPHPFFQKGWGTQPMFPVETKTEKTTGGTPMLPDREHEWIRAPRFAMPAPRLGHATRPQSKIVIPKSTRCDSPSFAQQKLGNHITLSSSIPHPFFQKGWGTQPMFPVETKTEKTTGGTPMLPDREHEWIRAPRFAMPAPRLGHATRPQSKIVIPKSTRSKFFAL